MKFLARHAGWACSMLLAWSASAQADTDPFVGTWIMDLQASHFASGQLPERMVIIMTPTVDGIHYRSEIKHAGGPTSVTEYSANYQGALSMVSGPTGMMAPVALKRIDSRTVEASYIRGLRVVATSRRITSPDGRTMTVTTMSSGPDGRFYTSVAVFKRAA